MLLFLGNFDNEVIEKEDWSTEHPNLENEALQTRNLSALYKHKAVPCQVNNANTAGIKQDNE